MLVFGASMEPAKTPENELKRLQALYDYQILDTCPEEQFDELTELASSLCKAPIALVSLIDETRQWFKSHHGLDATETPRNIAFCSHAILQDDIFEIPDCSKDERFSDNPLVTGEPGVTFYAGAPLITPNGHKLGTLCIIDHKAKKLTEKQKRQLRIVANQVVTLLELRKNTQLKENLLNELMLLIKQVNKKNEDLYQFSNRVAHDVGSPLRQIRTFCELSIRDLEKGDIDNATKKYSYLIDACSNLQILVNDIFDLSKADLNYEITDEINFSEVIEQSIKDANKTIGDRRANIEYTVDISNPFFSQTIRIRQILSNLISNAVKYLNPDQSSPFVKIVVAENDSGITILVKDNGLGIPEACQEKLFDSFTRFHPQSAEGSGLGTTIIKNYITSLEGTISFTSSEAGTEFIIALPRLIK
jgi:signal transduction histidine kinase